VPVKWGKDVQLTTEVPSSATHDGKDVTNAGKDEELDETGESLVDEREDYAGRLLKIAHGLHYGSIAILGVFVIQVRISGVVRKGRPYSTGERRVPELIPVLGSQPAGDVSHKPGGRLPLLSDRPAVSPATLKRAATNIAAW